MAWQACRVESCSGGFDFEPHQMHMDIAKTCNTCGTEHKFDDSLGRWTPTPKSEG